MDGDLRHLIAVRFEVDANWRCRRVAVPIWRVSAGDSHARPHGLFEMNSSKRPCAGEIVGVLAIGRHHLHFVGSLRGVEVRDSLGCCHFVIVREASGRFWSPRWCLTNAKGDEIWGLRPERRGVVTGIQRGVAISGAIDPVKCSIEFKDRGKLPYREWAKYEKNESDWSPPERFIKPTAFDTTAEWLLRRYLSPGCSVVCRESLGLFRTVPPISAGRLWDGEVSSTDPLEQHALLASCLYCCGWCI
jgi:hypothetical protein